MKNIETLIKKMIDIHVKDADVYVNNGSLWLIFTEEKKWVIELDNAGNLWYNYHFFYKIFKLISMNVVENQHYITRWVEDALQNGVKDTRMQVYFLDNEVEDALQNGVKDTRISRFNSLHPVEDALQNGVKRTWMLSLDNSSKVENTLQNGVKETLSNFISSDVCVEDIIQNGVKEVKGLPDMSGELRGYGNYYHKQKDRTKPHTQYVDDVIENSIKEKL